MKVKMKCEVCGKVSYDDVKNMKEARKVKRERYVCVYCWFNPKVPIDFLMSY